MEENTEKLNVEYIPPNFKEGITIMGFMFKVSYVIQGVPAVIIIIILVLTAGAGLDILVKLVIIIFTCVPVLFISAAGINGDSILGFLSSKRRNRKEKQTYIYNPRVKTEIRPLEETEAEHKMYARDKILRFIDRIRTGRDKKRDYEKMVFEGAVFEDDMAASVKTKAAKKMNGTEKKNGQKACRTQGA